MCNIFFSSSVTIMAVIGVANVIVVGVTYLSICLAVGMLVIVILVEMLREEWLLLGIF